MQVLDPVDPTRSPAARPVGASVNRAEARFRYTDPDWFWPEGGAAAASRHVQPAPAADVTVSVSERDARAVIAEAYPDLDARAFEVLPEHLGRVLPETDVFSAFNLAAFSTGAVVVIPPGAEVLDPIRVKTRIAQADRGVAATRNLFLVGRGARARIIESLEVDAAFANAFTEIVVQDGASMELQRLEHAGAGASLFSATGSVLGRDANLLDVRLLDGPGRLKSEVSATLAGRGASAEHRALMDNPDASHKDLRIVEDHAAADTVSRVTARAVVFGRAHAIVTGLLNIREHATGSDAYEEARGLLMSPAARADLLPELEILHHDVRASHGAAVGPLDEEARFYLMSRGIPPLEAERMLVTGFAEPVVRALWSEFADRLSWVMRDEA